MEQTQTKEKESKPEAKCPLCVMQEMMMGAAAEFRASEVGQHLMNSKREFLLAMRSMLDKCIERLETEEEEETVTRVEVD
jgi:hypothetical protein